MQRSGDIIAHAAQHCTAKLLEFTTLRGVVALTAYAAAYAARLPSLVLGISETRSNYFEWKKRSNYRAFRKISSQFSNKPSDSDSRRMKIWIKVVCSFLTFSKKPPPFPNPGWYGYAFLIPGLGFLF